MWTDHGETPRAAAVKAFVLVKMTDTTDPLALKSVAPPPSQVLKSEFSKLTVYPQPETFIRQEAEKVLLTPDDTKIWMDHLHTVLLNRKRGAAKAATTRRAKRSHTSEPLLWRMWETIC